MYILLPASLIYLYSIEIYLYSLKKYSLFYRNGIENLNPLDSRILNYLSSFIKIGWWVEILE